MLENVYSGMPMADVFGIAPVDAPNHIAIVTGDEKQLLLGLVNTGYYYEVIVQVQTR